MSSGTKQLFRSKDHNVLIPETAKKSERRNSFKVKKKTLTANNKYLQESENEEQIILSRMTSQKIRPKKFSHAIYDKAALMLDNLKEDKVHHAAIESLQFESEFEKRRACSLAFAAKRYEAILKDVLLDSSFYSSYFKLETYHHSKVLVMLLDFYDHHFRFSESARTKIEIDTSGHRDYIHEIQTAFFRHKTKLCSAFARNRIKACALNLDAMLPVEVKERGECGSRHFLCAWINPFVSGSGEVLRQLQEECNYVLENELLALQQTEDGQAVFCIDENFEDFLVFPPSSKDDIYNSDLVGKCALIPQSRPRYLMAEIVRNVWTDMLLSGKNSFELLQDLKLEETIRTGCDVILTHAETGSFAAHICAFINKNNKLYICGCHNDKKKLEIENNLKKMGVINYELISESFLHVSPTDDKFHSVKLIMCNPPCTKSAVVNPVDFILQEGTEAAFSLSMVMKDAQVRGFVEEQSATLRSAMLFPIVQSVVYFSFSIHAEENEKLVNEVLLQQAVGKNKFQLTSPLEKSLLEKIGIFDSKDSFICSSPSDVMDGFFVALLKRKIIEDSVKEIMDRAAKKGLLKKTPRSNKSIKKAVVDGKDSTTHEEPPNVAKRSSKQSNTRKKSVAASSSSTITKKDKKTDDKPDEDEAGRRFKF